MNLARLLTMAVRGSWNRYYGTASCPARLPGPLLRRYIDPYVVLELTRLWNHGRTVWRRSRDPMRF
jgi:hypothetical protein